MNYNMKRLELRFDYDNKFNLSCRCIQGTKITHESDNEDEDQYFSLYVGDFIPYASIDSANINNITMYVNPKLCYTIPCFIKRTALEIIEGDGYLSYKQRIISTFNGINRIENDIVD